tara:strand:- start:514 stop:1806 length:1293 start_codon:yes stop_codon:yes gene_type:complete
MNENFPLLELNRVVIFIGLVGLILVYRSMKRATYWGPYGNNGTIAPHPRSIGIFFAQCITLSVIIVSSSVLVEYSNSVIEYESDKCDDNRLRHKNTCTFEAYTSDDLSQQIDGFLMNQEVSTGFEVGDRLSHAYSPEGPWFWIYYILGGIIIFSGFRLAKRRKYAHMKDLRSVEEELRPLIRQLANDPRGVIEGRITMPVPVESSRPSARENRRAILIFLFCTSISIITIMSFINTFYDLESGFIITPGQNENAMLLAAMALGFNISGFISANYLQANYPGESNITTVAASLPYEDGGKITQNNRTSAKEVLEELAKEMRATRIESEMLRVQLNETRIQVSSLETELERKTNELETIQALTADMERIVKQNENSSHKNLSLMDAVLVGDPLFNGDKIDKQVVNDPKAIAKAAIDAYKAGRTDVKSTELDF